MKFPSGYRWKSRAAPPRQVCVDFFGTLTSLLTEITEVDRELQARRAAGQCQCLVQTRELALAEGQARLLRLDASSDRNPSGGHAHLTGRQFLGPLPDRSLRDVTSCHVRLPEPC